MGYNKMLRKDKIGKITTDHLEKEFNKITKRKIRYNELLDKKAAELDRIVHTDVDGHATMRTEDKDKYYELQNCIRLTESKIKKIDKKIKAIEDELVERMLTGEVLNV